MPGLSNAKAAATLDLAFPTSGASDFVGYSVNGTSETANLARTAIGATGWAAATVADPSVKANSAVLNTAAASAAIVVTHFAIFSDASGGTQDTDWQALSSPRSLANGEATSWAIGALQVTLT